MGESLEIAVLVDGWNWLRIQPAGWIRRPIS